MIALVIIGIAIVFYLIFKDDEPTLTELNDAVTNSSTNDLKVLSEIINRELKNRDIK